MKMKYVRTESLGFVLWSEHLPTSHADMARVMRSLCGEQVQSAGFVRLDAGQGPVCYGESTSLNLGPAADDSARLARQLDRMDLGAQPFRPAGLTA